MHHDFGISEEDWNSTPQSVKTTLTALAHQLRLFRVRFSAYEKKLAGLGEKAAEVGSLKTEVSALRERLGQNSSNSSLPPSSDAPQHRRPARRAAGGRKQGAQAGHQGRGRSLKPAEEVGRVVDLRPGRCVRCGRRLRGDDAQPFRHQVTGIPSVRAEVIEYRRHTLGRERCGAKTPAEWGEGVPAGSSGARLQAIVAYFTGRLSMSHRDAVEAVKVLHGVELSLGTVAAIRQRVSARLATPVETAHRYAQQQAINYVGETGWKEKSKQCWLWLTATKDVTTFHLLAERNSTAARAIIGSGRGGVITTDRFRGYDWLSDAKRQVCWAHLKRDFQAMVERGAGSKEIGEALLKQTGQLFDVWHQARDARLGRRGFQRLIAPVREKVKEQIEKGVFCKSPRTRGTCRELRRLETSLWAFARVRGVEPTNNQAERAVAARGAVAAQIFRHPKRGGQSVRRAHTDGGDHLAAARPRCLAVSHRCLHLSTRREPLGLPAAGPVLTTERLRLECNCSGT